VDSNAVTWLNLMALPPYQGEVVGG